MGSQISLFSADLVVEDLEEDCFHNFKNKYNIVPVFYFR